MQKKLFFLIFLLLLGVFFSGCTVREELQFKVELKDANLGFTVPEVSLSCIVTYPELVTTLNATLIDQNGEVFTLETQEVNTITTFAFENLSGGTYASSCIACDGRVCRSSEEGKVLVSIEDGEIEDYEFDLPPTFILGTPIDHTYFLSKKSLLVSFSCLANDDVGLSAVSLVSNVSGLFAETFIQTPTKSSHLLTKDLVLEPGNYLWTCRATDTRAQTIVAPVRQFTIGAATPDILPNITGFDGDTTDFASLATLTDVPGVVIEDTDFGKITFVDNISSLVGVDLSKGIIITKDSITVNSSLYPQLNVPAKLSFYDIKFDEKLEEAHIEKDGSTYSVQNLTYEDGKLTFSVGNFSTYTVVITPQGGYNLEVKDEEEPEIIEPIDVEKDDTLETDLGVIDPNNNAGGKDMLGALNETKPEEIIEEPTIAEEELQNITEEANDALEEELLIEGDATYFNPLQIAGLSVAVILIMALIVWIIKKKSNKTMLRKY